MIEAAHELGTENLLTIAGSTYIPWIPDRDRCRSTSATAAPASDRPAASRWPRSAAST